MIRKRVIIKRRVRKIWVEEVSASFETTHGSGGAVVGNGGFLRRVEGSEPPSFFGKWVPYLGGVTAPWPTPNSTVPYATAGAAVVFSQGSLCGGGRELLVAVVVVGEGLGGVKAVETPKGFFHIDGKWKDEVRDGLIIMV